ncbi:Lrp/AsnC family transcriptional regulator [Actinomadura parmotrematis]|uniref:Lrp/AsnC family transcriptional regulator n=1 Tax=Actinomadura parmotrematis TaxID=2864039 RepID=A0ABS7G4C0_9ACTN|nr:Lrp/AsnC family transcriptional regulator [Actinomadura parmotrematis]MBW8487210.1 Lrp/AsnC family transcriptional regulator [Actinomadura parmotrematis]
MSSRGAAARTDPAIDELDLALINALQLDPRAPWSRLAGPLGVDAATLSRRWGRLAAAGNAWVTCIAGASQLPYNAFAMIEVGCRPDALHEAAARIAADAQTITVEHTTGGRDLLLTVTARDLGGISDYVLHRLGSLDGVRFTRTHLGQRLYREASRWRLDSLSREQRLGLEHEAASGRDSGSLRADELALIRVLSEDGRQSYTALAERLGSTETRVRRLLNGMLAGGRAVLRCEAAHLLAGWRVTAMLWLRVPAPRLDAVADAVADLRETRMVLAVAGEANLMVNVWVRSMDELAAFEARLLKTWPDVSVADRCVTLRWIKRVGRLLDAHGRSTASIPLDVAAPFATAPFATAPPLRSGPPA